MILKRRHVRFVTTLAAAAALTTWVAARDHATAITKVGAGTLTMVELRPLSGHTESGIVHLTVRPRSASVVVAGLGGDDQIAYHLRLSRQSCSASPLLFGPSLAGPVGFTNTTLDDEAAVPIALRQLRAAKSIVLVADAGGGKFEPRACGTAYSLKLGDLLVSS